MSNCIDSKAMLKLVSTVLLLVHSWNTGGEPELISVLHTTANTMLILQRSCPQCSLARA